MGTVETSLHEAGLHINPAEIIAALERREASPWAILLCKFADDRSDVAARSHYERLFTSVGTGSSNMVDFFRDVSHGKLDLSHSQVFGWYTLGIDKSAYAGNVATPPAGQVNRNGLFDLCRQKATEEGVDLTHFKGVVVSMAGQVDLFGYIGGMAAMCDSLSLKPSLLGQEMGHGYGLDHARRNGSDEEYADPWDVMSTANAYMDDEGEYEETGPALNAAGMRSRDWLDETRVWKPGPGASDETVVLRPLHRRDLNGSLAAEVGEYLVEFRLKERWDAAIPRSCILIHRFSGNHSYVMQGLGGNYDLVEGDSFRSGIPNLTASSEVEVLSIDEGAREARLRIAHRPGYGLPHEAIWQLILGGVKVDGGGLGVTPGGHVHPIEPRGPMTAILEQLRSYAASESVDDVAARGAGQRAALTKIVQLALRELEANDAGLASREPRPDRQLLEKRQGDGAI